jgi:hypothetical protein
VTLKSTFMAPENTGEPKQRAKKLGRAMYRVRSKLVPPRPCPRAPHTQENRRRKNTRTAETRPLFIPASFLPATSILSTQLDSEAEGLQLPHDTRFHLRGPRRHHALRPRRHRLRIPRFPCTRVWSSGLRNCGLCSRSSGVAVSTFGGAC